MNGATGDWPAGWSVRWVSETGSTNADLLAAARAGAAPRSVLAADHQTAGRGRLDRRWEAPPGANLLVSILMDAQSRPAHQHTQLVALAARSACAQVAGVDVDVKWPNDLLLRGAKLAGVLAEAAGTSVVVGIGVNVGWAPEGAARLADAAPTVTPRTLLHAFLTALGTSLDDPVDVVHRRYAESLSTIGQRVRIERAGADDLVGEAVGVEPDGRLIVAAGDAEHRIDTGDVIHLRSA